MEPTQNHMKSKDPAHKDGHRTYSIRQLSKEFDVTARALRFYEDKGLIKPERRGQTRLYSPRDRARLQLILRGKRLGFSLHEIHEILDLYTPKDHGAAQMKATLSKYRTQIDTLKRQREDIDAAIRDMQEGCVWLEEQIKVAEAENLQENRA
ncbi:MAG TPA: MerR family DNA-binding transcriptional regulator [Asticcacaulis sp.]|nr:MerR family DNA-binding transcriptional regulator [Asticcacaulis sp.]